MIKKIHVLIILLNLNTYFTKECGIYSIIDEKIKINSKNYEIFNKNKSLFSKKKNFKSFTIFGWIKIKDKKKKIHPIFSFQYLYLDKKKKYSNTTDVFSAIYDNSQNNGDLKLTNFFDKEIDNKNVNNIIDKWFFFAFSFNFRVKIIKIFFEGKNFIFEKENYLDFERKIKQNFVFNIACDNSENKNCSNIVIKNINYTLENFENINNLYLLTDKKNNKINSYFFDIYNNKNKIKKIKQKNIVIEGKPSFIDEDGLIYYKGKNIIKLKAPEITSFNGIKTQSGLIIFKFTKDIPNNFKLLTFHDKKNEVIFEIILNQNHIERKRSIILNIPKINKSIQTKPILKLKKLEKISFSIIEKYGNFQIWLNHDKEVVSSEFLEGSIFEKGDYILFEKLDFFLKGGIIVYQINFLDNSKGFFYNLNKENSKCYEECNFLFGFENRAQCGDCKKRFVLDYRLMDCVDICPLNFKNEENRCFECREENCGELDHDYFEIKKINENTFEVFQKKEINNFYGDLEDIIDFNVSNANLNQNFRVLKTKENKNKIFFNFEPINNFAIENSQVNFFLKKNLNFSDGLKNRIYIKNQKFKLNKKTEKISKNQYHNKKVKKAFGILGKIAAIIFFLSMLIGLIGIFYKCKKMQNQKFHDFYYQKFIQTFLISQYIAFWSLYNTELPSNLENYFHCFISYTITWHGIFENLIYKKFSDKPDFVKNWNVDIFHEFYKENIHYNFVINFGFIFLVQLFVLFISMIVFLIYNKKKNLIKSKIYNDFTEEIKINKEISFSVWSLIKNHFFYKFIFSIFLMFIIETIIFALYNFNATKFCFKNPFYIFSFIISIIWIIILFILWFYIAIYSFKSETQLVEKNFQKKFGFIYQGLEYINYKKQFQSIQYLHYALFAIILVCSYNNRLVQIILNFIIYFLFFLLIVLQKPANTNFWKKEQSFIHSLLLIAKCFIFSLVVDDKTNLMDLKQRWIIGFIIMIFTFLCILWNFFILIYKLLEFKKNCQLSNYQKPEIKIDRDYEGPNTLYQTDGGTYHKIKRPDLVEENQIINNSDSTPSFYKTVFSERKKKFLEELENRPVLNSLIIGDPAKNKKKFEDINKKEDKKKIGNEKLIEEIDKDLKMEEIVELPFNEGQNLGLDNENDELISILNKVKSQKKQ